MHLFMIALLETSIAMSIIILTYAAITPFLSKRFTAKGRYYTWLVIVIGMIIPIRFYTKKSVIYLDHLFPAIKTTKIQTIDQVVANGGVTQSGMPWLSLIVGLWVGGMILFIAYQLLQHRRFLKMVGRWSTNINNGKLLEIMEKMKRELGVKEKINLRTCTGISSPMLLGFIRPTLLIPVKSIPLDELPYIFKHELVHFKRRDIWYKVLVILATALHWFNPFVYLMAREISMQCEISCDEEVIKNTNIACRQKYVEAIIGVIRKQSVVQSGFSTNLYNGKQGMKNRVYSIMDMKEKKWGYSILTIILLATFSTGILLKINDPALAEAKLDTYENLGEVNQIAQFEIKNVPITSKSPQLEVIEKEESKQTVLDTPNLLEVELEVIIEPEGILIMDK